jgi:hypothetical protein
MLLAHVDSSVQSSPAFDLLAGPRHDTTAGLPAAARRAMAQLTDGGQPRLDPRGLARQAYHVQAELTRRGESASTTVYTRDVNAFAVGLIATGELTVGAKVSLRLLFPDGHRQSVGARVRRCRPFASGWFEIHAEFCLPQYPFENL